MISTEIKEILNSIGYEPKLVRRVAISTYEGEMNVVMHARKGVVTLKANDEEILISIEDEGKGIPDVEKAMQEGFLHGDRRAARPGIRVGHGPAQH